MILLQGSRLINIKMRPVAKVRLHNIAKIYAIWHWIACSIYLCVVGLAWTSRPTSQKVLWTGLERGSTTSYWSVVSSWSHFLYRVCVCLSLVCERDGGVLVEGVSERSGDRVRGADSHGVLPRQPGHHVCAGTGRRRGESGYRQSRHSYGGS